MLTHIVQKPFRDSDRKIASGELVNALGWPLVSKLVAQRYLVPIPHGLQPVQSTDGRWWADRAMLGRAGVQEQRPTPVPPLAGEGAEEPATVAENAPEVAEEPRPSESPYPKTLKGGWYILSNGTKVKGKRKAIDAEAALA